ncbi:MAG: hypothetical protein II375_09730 [Bacteroidales bacterium]|nr:hypothetical protein [Bacteroidales bacterium]
MNIQSIISIAALAATLVSCSGNAPAPSSQTPDQPVAQPAQSVATEGNEITYNVYIKPQYMNDPDAAELYANFDRAAFVDSLFSAVYTKGVKVTDMDGNPMTIDDIKIREVEDPNFSRDKVAGIRFREVWSYNPSTNTMTKKVKSMLVGYEVVEDSTIVALRPNFEFHFD